MGLFGGVQLLRSEKFRKRAAVLYDCYRKPFFFWESLFVARRTVLIGLYVAFFDQVFFLLVHRSSPVFDKSFSVRGFCFGVEMHVLRVYLSVSEFVSAFLCDIATQVEKRSFALSFGCIIISAIHIAFLPFEDQLENFAETISLNSLSIISVLKVILLFVCCVCVCVRLYVPVYE